MKNTKLIIGIVVALVITGTIAFWQLNKAKPVQQVAETARATATATMLEKTLLIDRAGTTTEAEIATKDTAEEGDTLKTLPSGRALVEDSNGTKTVLDYNSMITIAKLDPDGTHTSMFLGAGSVWARVKKVFGQGEYYEIETKNGVAVVRGTAFEVTYSASSTTLLVDEGDVSLIPVDPTTRERQTDKEVHVLAGMKGVIGTDGKVTESKMSDSEKQNGFFTFGLDQTADTQTDAQPQTQPENPNTQNPTPTPAAASVQAEANANAQGEIDGQGTLRSLLATGKDLTCTYTSGNGGSVYAATMYFSKGQMRGDFALSGAGAADSHMIQTGTEMYAWTASQGVKMDLAAVSGNTDVAGAIGSYANLDQQLSYKCVPWTKDTSKFAIPATINFIDIGAMMKAQGVGSTGN